MHDFINITRVRMLIANRKKYPFGSLFLCFLFVARDLNESGSTFKQIFVYVIDLSGILWYNSDA